jgi:hypothetical protein
MDVLVQHVQFSLEVVAAEVVLLVDQLDQVVAELEVLVLQVRQQLLIQVAVAVDQEVVTVVVLVEKEL